MCIFELDKNSIETNLAIIIKKFSIILQLRLKIMNSIALNIFAYH